MARKIFGKIQGEWGLPQDVELRVIVWDADIDEDDRMGTSHVEKDGTYSIEFTDDKWDWSPLDSITKWRPDVYIVVETFDQYSQTWKELARSKVYSDLDVRQDQEINLFVNFSYTNSNSIYGFIKAKNGEPIKDITVSAWDEKKTLFSTINEQESSSTMISPSESTDFIGSSKTNTQGEYKILFDPSLFAITLERVLKEGLDAYRRPDIFIKIHNLDGKGILARSPTKQNVISQLGCRIDFII